MVQKTLPRIIGINQLADETAMVKDERDPTMFVREANNVDIDKEGNVNRRLGYTQLLAGVGWHSLYSSQRGWLLICHNNELGVYEPDTGTTTLLTVMDSKYLTSYAEENGNLYVMNPGFSCMFKPGSTEALPLGVELPNLIPQFTASTAQGSLEAGRYGITYSIIDAAGEESGLGPIVEVELTAQGSIVGTGFTVTTGHKYRVYMTSVNGEELYETAEFNATVTTITIMQHLLGRQPRTFGLEPTPYGHILRAFNSRLLVGTTDFVYFTEAFRPHLHDAAHGWVTTSGFTTMVEPVEGGVFIADKRGVRFYSGDDPTQWEVKEASPHPVVFGTSQVVAGADFGGDFSEFDSVVVWLTEYGYHVGTPDGGVVKLNAEQVRLPSYVQGCSAFAIRDGRKQFVTPVDSNILASASVALDSSIS